MISLQEAYETYITLRFSGDDGYITVSEDMFLPCVTIGLIKRAEELDVVSVNANHSFYRVIAEADGQVKNNITYRSLPENATEKNKVISRMQKDLDIEEQAVQYCISELIDNIQEHSQSNHSCMLAQRYPKHQILDVFVADNGVTIPRSYEAKSIAMNDDCEAIEKALEGWSTKNEEGRGRGLGTTWRLIQELGGEGILYSRNAGLNTSSSGTTLYTVNDEVRFSGTMVAFRVPCDASLSNKTFYGIVDETV